MNAYDRVGESRTTYCNRRPFYINGNTYETTPSDIRNLDKILHKGDFSQVSVKLHLPSNTEVIEKKIRKQEKCAKYIDIERYMISIASTQYIVKYFGFLEDQVDLFLYMEGMECCFRQLLEFVKSTESAFPPLLVHSVAYSVTQALQFLKQHSILHRDVKPSNILLNRQGQIKLSDFGLSKTAEDGRAFSKGIGTYEYNAPERIGSDKQHHSYPADMWSLGISLVELVTLEHPIRKGLSRDCSQFELMIAIKNSAPVLSTAVISSPTLCDFVNLCLQHCPEDRITLDSAVKHPVFLTKHTTEEVKCWFRALPSPVYSIHT